MAQQLQSQRDVPRARDDSGRGSRSAVHALVTGLGAMLGVGVFSGFGPAVAVAGWWVLPGIVLAAAATVCFAVATHGAARVHGGAGGSYEYLREHLGATPGRMAAALLLCGRAAAAAALASALGAHLAPGQAVPAAVGVVAVATVFRAAGGELGYRSRLVGVLLTLLALGVVIAACFAVAPPEQLVVPTPGAPGANDPGAVVMAAAIAFLGFNGFERVTSPASPRRRYSPRALRVALPVLFALVTVLYLLVTVGLLHQLGSVRLALSPTPLRDALVAANAAALEPLVVLGAVTAMLPALLLALGGVRDIVAGVIRERDLPLAGRLAGPGRSWRLDVVGGGLVAILVVALGQTAAFQLAATCLLFYYAFCSAGCRLVLAEGPLLSMRAACLGMGVAVIIGMSAPLPQLLAAFGIAVVAAGLGALISRRSR
ncbi:MAG TPA: amino acid permease [Pseudonocardiaceae bacterium]